MAHEGKATIRDHLGAPWPTIGIGVLVSKALAALGSAPHATVVHVDGWTVSLVTHDTPLHQKGDPA
ncbi:MAG TPA: hypothetical protein VIH59_20610 [Candidatus Tectomicrobia bacterium]|jgi:hypothetical protein